MDLNSFIQGSGLKVLSMAKLSEVESSIIFYFLNCAFSGLEELIISDERLSSLIGSDPASTQKALSSLISKNIIRSKGAKDSCMLSIEYDISKWTITGTSITASTEAVIYPFRSKGGANLKVISLPQDDQKEDIPIFDQIYSSFTEGKTIEDSNQISKIKDDIKLLLSTYPPDQVLALVKYFKHKLPSLSLLASAWSHFIEIYEIQTQTVDMNQAKKQQAELDKKLKDKVSSLLSPDSSSSLQQEEISVLEMILNHKFPRRQLYWAYQARSNYPNLKNFLEENKNLMLAVTNSGKTLKP